MTILERMIIGFVVATVLIPVVQYSWFFDPQESPAPERNPTRTESLLGKIEGTWESIDASQLKSDNDILGQYALLAKPHPGMLVLRNTVHVASNTSPEYVLYEIHQHDEFVCTRAIRLEEKFVSDAFLQFFRVKNYLVVIIRLGPNRRAKKERDDKEVIQVCGSIEECKLATAKDWEVKIHLFRKKKTARY